MFDEQYLMDILHGGRGGYGGYSRKRPNAVLAYDVTLEDMYNGKTAKLKVSKKVVCSRCKGLGGKSGSVFECKTCEGHGFRIGLREFRPGLMEQVKVLCENCNGDGETIDPDDRCKLCVGKKLVQEESIVHVKIKPGMRDGERLVFYGEGDQQPGSDPVDLELVIRTKPHETFDRKGDELVVRKKISLNEALCGYSTMIQHLDGRNLVMSSMFSDIIHPNTPRMVVGEGMPKTNSKGRGNLYVVFSVQFPENYFLTENQFKKLEALLPSRPALEIPADVGAEEVTLSDFDERRHGAQTNSARQRDAYYEDCEEDDSDRDERVGRCAQQ